MAASCTLAGMDTTLSVYTVPARLRGRVTLVRVWARDLAHARLIVTNTYGECLR